MDYTGHQRDYVINLVKNDPWMMDVLGVVKEFNLPDWWIAAGFVRNKVWDTLHGYEKRTAWADTDVDVVYFDPKDIGEATEKEIELQLYTRKPGVPWSVKNQARMHSVNDELPFESSIDAVSRWVETATCVAVKLDDNDQVVLATPLGLEDVLGMILRPNTRNNRNPQLFEQRLIKKHWLQKWPKLKVEHA